MAKPKGQSLIVANLKKPVRDRDFTPNPITVARKPEVRAGRLS